MESSSGKKPKHNRDHVIGPLGVMVRDTAKRQLIYVLGYPTIFDEICD